MNFNNIQIIKTSAEFAIESAFYDEKDRCDVAIGHVVKGRFVKGDRVLILHPDDTTTDAKITYITDNGGYTDRALTNSGSVTLYFEFQPISAISNKDIIIKV